MRLVVTAEEKPPRAQRLIERRTKIYHCNNIPLDEELLRDLHTSLESWCANAVKFCTDAFRAAFPVQTDPMFAEECRILSHVEEEFGSVPIQAHPITQSYVLADI